MYINNVISSNKSALKFEYSHFSNLMDDLNS